MVRLRKKRHSEPAVQSVVKKRNSLRPRNQKRPGMHAFQSERPWTQEMVPLRSHDLLPSRLYCRPRSFTGSCLSARGLYRRWGIAPRPEDPDSVVRIIRQCEGIVNPWTAQGRRTFVLPPGTGRFAGAVKGHVFMWFWQNHTAAGPEAAPAGPPLPVGADAGIPPPPSM